MLWTQRQKEGRERERAAADSVYTFHQRTEEKSEGRWQQLVNGVMAVLVRLTLTSRSVRSSWPDGRSPSLPSCEVPWCLSI